MSKPNTIQADEERVYGFWHYDLFPYVLGAPGRLIDEGDKGRYQELDYRQGCFLAEGYGGAAFSNPITMPLEKGSAIRSELETIRAEYEAASDALKAGFMKRVRKLLPNLPE